MLARERERELSSLLEKLQTSAMRIIFGWDVSYQWIVEENSLEYLYVIKSAGTSRFREKRFPEKTFTHHDLKKEK